MGRARDLAGQVVVVTGAARGLGAFVARRLAARGARVALLGLEPDELARVAASCGPRSRWWEVDVTDERALADVAAGVRDAFGRIDVVVANAGIATGGPFMHSDAGSFTRVIEVNLLGSVATARAFLPDLAGKQGLLPAGGVARRARPVPDDGGVLREQGGRRGVRPFRAGGGGAPRGTGRRRLPELDRHRHGARRG